MVIYIPEWILWLVGVPFCFLVFAWASLGLWALIELAKGERQ